MVFISATKTVESAATARDFGWKLVGADAGLQEFGSAQQKAIDLTFQGDSQKSLPACANFPHVIVVADRNQLAFIG